MGDRQELPVARIHARGAGQRLAQAGFAASEKAARAAGAVKRGGVVFAKGLAAIALPALFIGLVGASSSRHGVEPRTQIKIPTVRFDDAYMKSLPRIDYTQFRYTPPKIQLPNLTFDRGELLRLSPSRSKAVAPGHEPTHRPTW